ncbi:MAG: vWA domain-containing protein [bacterium]
MEETRVISTVPEKPFSLEAYFGNRYALYSVPTRDYLLVRIRAIGTPQIRAPLNLCLVIDRSGSMEGEPLEHTKKACAYVVDLLEPEDILSIVTFAEDVQVIMPPRKVVNKELIKSHIMRIEVGDTTNLYDGLLVGGNQLKMLPLSNYTNRILLFTDGEPTTGIRDYPTITQLAGDLREAGMKVTALGFGLEYNEELLVGIAKRGGGNYYYISRPELIQEVFRREMESLLTIALRNPKVRIHLSRWVRARDVLGYSGEYKGRDVEVQLVDLEKGASLSLLAELELEPRPKGIYRIARVEVEADDLKEKLAEDVVVEFVEDVALLQQGVNEMVRKEWETKQAARSIEKTLMAMKTQAISTAAAVAELERTKVFLTNQGRLEEAKEVEQAIESLKKGTSLEAEKTLIGTIYKMDIGKKKEEEEK